MVLKKNLWQWHPVMTQIRETGRSRNIRNVQHIASHVNAKDIHLLLRAKPLHHGSKVAARASFLEYAKRLVDESLVSNYVRMGQRR